MEFRNDAEHGQYVLEDDGPDGPMVVGLAQYREFDGRLIFPHTEIDPDYEGQGLAGKLVSQALDDVRALGRKVVPTCPFVRSYIERHPDYDDLVDHDMLTALLGED